MIIFHQVEGIREYAAGRPELWSAAGFVPTMGALHQGHISLIEHAKKAPGITVASIFVNPSQFNDQEDFKKYPITLDKDIRALEEAGCDILFLPGVKEIYPNGWQKHQSYELGTLETVLEGFYRPGHFQGVCQVVHRLLDIVKPGSIFMGQKDYQQCMVIQYLIEQKNLAVRFHTCPTLREPDGLAMSSRNLRLNAGERQIAPSIYREMKLIENGLGKMQVRALEARAIQNLLASGFRSVDYVSIAHPTTLQPLAYWEPGAAAVILAAAFLGAVRLIDNLVIEKL